jgi:hypothetical protein
MWAISSRRLAGLKTLFDALDDTVDMLGVMNFLSSPALHLVERGAGVVVPAFVVPVDPARLLSR